MPSAVRGPRFLSWRIGARASSLGGDRARNADELWVFAADHLESVCQGVYCALERKRRQQPFSLSLSLPPFFPLQPVIFCNRLIECRYEISSFIRSSEDVSSSLQKILSEGVKEARIGTHRWHAITFFCSEPCACCHARYRWRRPVTILNVLHRVKNFKAAILHSCQVWFEVHTATFRSCAFKRVDRTSIRLWCHKWTITALSNALSISTVAKTRWILSENMVGGACSGLWGLTNQSKLAFSEGGGALKTQRYRWFNCFFSSSVGWLVKFPRGINKVLFLYYCIRIYLLILNLQSN